MILESKHTHCLHEYTQNVQEKKIKLFGCKGRDITVLGQFKDNI